MSKDAKDINQDVDDVDISPITGKPIQKKFAPKKRRRAVTGCPRKTTCRT